MSSVLPNSDSFANFSTRGDVAAVAPPFADVESTENRMVGSKLGHFAGLFLALRAKHPPTATHCLRVALTCSAWGQWRQMPEDRLELLEAAALLHDLGKVGVPDRILQKPMRLSHEEIDLVEMHPHIGAEILRAAGVSSELLRIIEQAIQCTGSGIADTHGELLGPRCMEARMLAIIDAFDSMTTDHVYRRAFSRERALAELHQGAGTQFDPELVSEFSQFIASPFANERDQIVVQRWLHQLAPDFEAKALAVGGDASVISGVSSRPLEDVFHRRLLDYMPDGVIFVDNEMRILEWNRAAERLTGIAQSAVLHQQWYPEMLRMLDERAQPIVGEDCPILQTSRKGMQSQRRLHIVNREGRVLVVEAHCLPIFDRRRRVCGATLMIRDASHQASLEERVQSLHEKATRDPLTGVANRAELNRALPEFVREHLASGEPASVVICDIDFFKRINDNFGHQAGDDALKCFAEILKQNSRSSDLVARYGGEEFVLLCEGCDITAATQRAEALRVALSTHPIEALKNHCISASFGVTQVQPGDDESTALARADRALLMAKETGRNRVVQLGIGPLESPVEEKKTQHNGWLGWLKGNKKETEIVCELITAVPLDLAVEKLKGFVSDHKAEILQIHDRQILLKVNSPIANSQRRASDRQTPMYLQVDISEVDFAVTGPRPAMTKRTLLETSIRPVRVRDRRLQNVEQQANSLLKSFESYMVASVVDEPTKKQIFRTLSGNGHDDRR